MSIHRNTPRAVWAAGAFAIVYGAAAQASPLEIRVDFGDAVLSGGNWNNVTQQLVSVNAIDFNTGLSTGIMVGQGNNNGASNAVFDEDWVIGTAVRDYVISPSHNTSVAGLTNVPEGEYQLEVVYIADYNDDQNGARFTINSLSGQKPDRTYQGNPLPADEWNAKTDGFQKTDWLIFDSVSPNAQGQIIIYASKDFPEFNSVGINALRLTAVPEPAMAMISLPSLLLFGRRRRPS